MVANQGYCPAAEKSSPGCRAIPVSYNGTRRHHLDALPNQSHRVHKVCGDSSGTCPHPTHPHTHFISLSASSDQKSSTSEGKTACYLHSPFSLYALGGAKNGTSACFKAGRLVCPIWKEQLNVLSPAPF